MIICRQCGLPDTDKVHNPETRGWPDAPGTCMFIPEKIQIAEKKPEIEYVMIPIHEYNELIADRTQLRKIRGFIDDYYKTLTVCKHCGKKHQGKCNAE